MRETLRAFATTFGFGFRSAPWHTTVQLSTGVAMSIGGLLSAYGGKLVIDAASRGDLRLGLFAGVVAALTTALTLLAVFVYVNSTFAVLERGHAEADRRLMWLLGGGDGLAHHERADYLDQVHRIREDRTHLGSVVNQSSGILRAFASLAMAAILLSSIHPALLVLLVLGILSFLIGRRARDMEIAAQEATSESERLRRHLYDLGTTASTGKEMRIFGLTRELVRRHHEASDRVIGVRNRADWRAAALQSIDAVLGAAGYVGAIVVVLLLALDGQATPGDVVLAVGVVAQLDGSMASAVLYGTSFLRGLAVARRLRWLERYTAEVARVPTDPAPRPERLHDGIELRNVSFGYPDTGSSTLRNVSLMLPAGAVVALVGENGAGKTTLVKLLSGFYEADAGEMLVDGVDVRRHSMADWQARVSAAFQDHTAFEFPVRETVGVGDLCRIEDRDAVRSALERADASAVVDVLPDGLDTQLGTVWDGVDLSGGQWQRLALARGLMRDDPLLVVFDEPTAALDPQTEHAMFERFAAAARSGERQGTITLLVSHRFSTVRMADLIVVLDGGGVREVGSHQDLIGRGDLYADLYELQSRAYR